MIEHGLKIDLRQLRRQGIFRQGRSGTFSYSWTSGASISLSFEALLEEWDHCLFMRLRYFANGQRVDDVITLERFSQPFGGFRWYFICPTTKRRCQCLYMPPGARRFRSRRGFQCRLLYLSQTLRPEARYHEQARRVARRVFEAWPAAWRVENEDKWDFPPKPRGMRWRTYKQLDQRYDAYEEASIGNWMERVAKIIAR